MRFLTISNLSWKMQRNEVPLKVFIATFSIRVICQSLFFLWFAKVLGTDEWVQFALYGSIIIPAINILFIDIYNVIKFEIDERVIDTLTISGTPLILILIGRTIGYIFKTLIIIFFTYLVIAIFLDLDVHTFYHFFTALPLLITAVISAYSVAIFMSSLNMKENFSQMLPNFSLLLLAFMGNFTFPVEALPKFLQILSTFLPLRHIMDAFRMYMVEQVPYWLNLSFYLEIILALIYATLGYGIFLHSLKAARKNPINN